jgi:hypothetical protein
MDEFMELLLKARVIDVGEVRVARTTLGRREGPRYLIYLPMNRNYIWQALNAWGRRVRVFVFVEVPMELWEKVSSNLKGAGLGSR